jgi:tRNA splicing endonuclease
VERSLTSVVSFQEAKELLDAFADTIRELIRLHEDQFQALVASDTDSQRFDDLIHMANERKHNAKYAYMHHLEIHGCSTIDGTNQK